MADAQKADDPAHLSSARPGSFRAVRLSTLILGVKTSCRLGITSPLNWALPVGQTLRKSTWRNSLGLSLQKGRPFDGLPSPQASPQGLWDQGPQNASLASLVWCDL